MKTKISKIILLALLISFGLNTIAQVAINNDGSSADASAMFEVKSTDKGLLPPRMTEAQRDAITPTEGLIVYNTTTHQPNYYNGTVWMNYDGTSVPGAPTIGIAVAGNTQASVSFTAPANDGNSEITEYTATSTPDGITGTLTQAESGTITVTGLTNGTAYTFTVTATNAIGTSAASVASNSVTPAIVAPDAPTIGIAMGGIGYVTVTYTAPVNNGGSTITSYTATSTPDNFTSTLNQSESGTITVIGLTNGTAYTFTVTATNAIGTGAASAASNSVTPTETVIIDVTNPSTGEIWMDRNLGATQIATSSTDANSYGDYYQWGRGADGHQIETSSTTNTRSTGDDPGNSFFIVGYNDWRSTQNNNLWQGVNGINNPCPNGYRIPTKLEWEAEIATWPSEDPEGAFGSLLKLPVAGQRIQNDGTYYYVGSWGNYWSSGVYNESAQQVYFYPGNAGVGSNSRASGKSVRCIKD